MKIAIAILFISMLTLASCGGDSSLSAKDTINQNVPVDSMPVVAPPVNDSEAVIKTPPTNDENVIVPDSTHR